MNRVILMGRLTRNPEVRYTQGERPMAVARYTLAVDRRGRRGICREVFPPGNAGACIGQDTDGKLCEMCKGCSQCTGNDEEAEG